MPTTETTEKLAIHGGEPSIQQAPAQPRRWGDAERVQLDAMLEQSSLFYWNGPQTKLLTERFQGYYPLQYVMPCSSGTAALHIAVAAAGIVPGDEVITTPVTDMGTVIGILYQGGVPVFADLQPHTYNLDPADVRRKITSKTKAIIAVHLTGNPCDLAALRLIADEHGLILIEDCAQAWGAQYGDTPVGTVGHIGCWSLNDFKHIGCGDGGIVASSDPRFGPLLQKYGDKAYDRSGGLPIPDVLAPNYRISEPQSAVAAAQIERMWDITGKRGAVGQALSAALQGTPGIHAHKSRPEDRWTCWYYILRINPDALTCDAPEFAAALAAEGLPAKAPFLSSPIYKYPVFQTGHFFGKTWPARDMGLTTMDYTTVRCEQAEAILQTGIQILVHEGMDENWVQAAAAAIRKVARHFAA